MPSHYSLARPRRDGRIIVPVPAPFVDARGRIYNLVEAPFSSVVRITSLRGAVRGNHYHKTDYHFCWLEEGGLIYYERPVHSRVKPARRVIRPGQLFFTSPMMEHMMEFTQRSVFFVFARNPRGMAHYEADTVRVPPLAE